MMHLRPYQHEAIEAIMAYWQAGGGNPLVDLATGTGKSLVIATLTKRLLEAYPDMRVLMLVHVRELVAQNAQALLRSWPDAPLGIYSAGLGKRDTHRRIIFGSIQSLYRQDGHSIGHRDLVLVDEAHLVPTSGNGMYRRLLDSLRQTRPDLRVAGLTATPYRLDSGRLDDGNDRIFDKTVYSYGIADGITDGYLSPLVSKASATEIDVSDVQRRGGEFVAGQLEVAADKITREAVREIVAFGENRRSWLLFCSGVEHAYNTRDAIRAHGITCETVTGDTPSGERDAILRRFKDGKIRCLTNAQVLCLDAETEILTSEGFVGIDDMMPQHQIAAWKEDGGIEFAPPKRIIRRPRFEGEKMVAFGNGVAAGIRVTGNHRMVVRCGGNRSKIKVVSAEELAGKACSIPAFGTCEPVQIEIDTPQRKQPREQQIRATSYNLRKRGYDTKTAKTMAVDQVNRLRSMRYASPHELTLDECRLIGFWLGDGSLSCGRCVMSQSMRYADNVEWFDGVLASTRISHSRHIRTKRSGLSNDVVVWSLARGTGGYGQTVDRGYFYLEPYLNKAGSRYLRNLTKEQLEAVLEGFWRADGNHHSGEKYKYITGTQYSLYDVLQSVCVMRGISASISAPIPGGKPNHSTQWRFSWGGRKDWGYTKEGVKIEGGWKDERVWCVTSSTSYLICRRRGKVFVTGNTTGFDAPQVDMVAFLRATLSTSLYVQIVGRGTRIAPGKENCLVLDFGGNIRRHGPVDAVSVLPKNGGGDDSGKVGVDSVRAKECPECQSMAALNASECKVCGHEWPRDEKPHHEAQAEAQVGILSSEQVPPQMVPVVDWRFDRHQKIGAPDSVRVTYMAGLSEFREWLAFEHGGYATQKACQWWTNHGGDTPFPKSTGEAIDRSDELIMPATISVKPRGKYWDICGRTFGRKQKGEAA